MLGALLAAVPHALIAVGVFVFFIQCGRAADRRLTFGSYVIGGAVALAWPVSILVWLVIHRGGSV